MAAAQAGHGATVCALLQAGADPRLSMWDGAGPLFLAAQNGHHNIVSMLLTQPGTNVDQQRRFPTSKPCLTCFNILRVIRDGATPLWISSQMGHDTCVRLLLQHGAGVDLARQDGATPLFKACHKGHEEVVKEILKYNPRLGNLQVVTKETVHNIAYLVCIIFGHHEKIFNVLEWMDLPSRRSSVRSFQSRNSPSESGSRSQHDEFIRKHAP